MRRATIVLGEGGTIEIISEFPKCEKDLRGKMVVRSIAPVRITRRYIYFSERHKQRVMQHCHPLCVPSSKNQSILLFAITVLLFSLSIIVIPGLPVTSFPSPSPSSSSLPPSRWRGGRQTPSSPSSSSSPPPPPPQQQQVSLPRQIKFGTALWEIP